MPALAAPGDPPPFVGNGFRTATEEAICTASMCASAEVKMVCTQDTCSDAPLPPAPCDAGSCISEKAKPDTKG